VPYPAWRPRVHPTMRRQSNATRTSPPPYSGRCSGRPIPRPDRPAHAVVRREVRVRRGAPLEKSNRRGTSLRPAIPRCCRCALSDQSGAALVLSACHEPYIPSAGIPSAANPSQPVILLCYSAPTRGTMTERSWSRRRALGQKRHRRICQKPWSCPLPRSIPRHRPGERCRMTARSLRIRHSAGQTLGAAGRTALM